MHDTELGTYLRSLVVGVNTKVPVMNGQYVPAINFDNAATTPPLHAVMKEVMEFAPWYSSIHRGTGYKSIFSSELYDEGREMIKRFVNADAQKDIVIYTKNATEAINVLCYQLSQAEERPVIISTEMEHLANDLPWRQSCFVDYIAVDAQGKLVIQDVECKLRRHKGKVRLVAVTGASNVTGYITPIYHIARLAHAYGAQILVDGAQFVPHCRVDMKAHNDAEHIDFLVFSAHKMYAPFGSGVLIGPKTAFIEGQPYCKGGGAVELVSQQFVDWDQPPFKQEAGTPNVIGVAALLAAIKVLNCIGMDVIHEYEHGLITYMMEGLKTIPGLKLYGYTEPSEARVSLVSFRLPGFPHRMLAKLLAHEAGIAVRSGLFCAHPYVEKLLGLTAAQIEYYRMHDEEPFPGLVRVSFGMYNNYQEIDIMLSALEKIARNKAYYQRKFEHLCCQPVPLGPICHTHRELP